jgi:excisionase family DNA binding protein
MRLGIALPILPSVMSRLADAELTEIGGSFAPSCETCASRNAPEGLQRSGTTAAARRRRLLTTVESPPSDEAILSPREMARVLRVNSRTLARWADEEGLPSIRTLGGHRRYRWADVTAWLERTMP